MGSNHLKAGQLKRRDCHHLTQMGSQVGWTDTRMKMSGRSGTMVRTLVGICVAAALGAGPGNATAQETVKIGVVLPMTGPFQSTGWQANAALKLFLHQPG